MTEVDDVPIGHAAIDGQYWHIGAMTMRLPSSRAPTRNGVNSALILSSPYSWRSAVRENLLTADWGNDGFGFFFQRSWNSQPANRRPRAGQYYQPMQQRWW
jgi:hypothetical protein